MRILWWSNPPWASTGYGVQTRLFLPRLAKAGHEVAFASLYGLHGGPITWQGIQCYPQIGEFGQNGIARHSESWKADLTISLFDAWAFETRLLSLGGMRWVPWFPVDMEPLPRVVKEKVTEAYASIVFSRFGEEACRRAGLDPYYIPHGVDLSAFTPLPRDQSRRALGCPEDCFVVGMVAANKDHPSRKSIPQVVEAFARFAKRHSDAHIYLHTMCNDGIVGQGAINVLQLAEHFGIKDRVHTAEPYYLAMGYSDEYMAQVYSALDCLASPSLGEGFGVPILEAQACGCPVLVGDWSSTGELCFAGHKIPRECSEHFWTGLNSFFQLPHISAIEDGLERLYRKRGDKDMRRLARAGAEGYDVNRVVSDYWLPVLQSLEARGKTCPVMNRKAALLLETLANAPDGSVAEIGSVRCRREAPADGFSTVYLARACIERGSRFQSFDIDPMTVDIANRVLEQERLPPCVRCSNGVDVLRELEPQAFLYLDSSDDPTDTLNQFTAAALVPGGIVVVDDAQGNVLHPFGKATALVTLLSELGQPFRIVTTLPGYAALVYVAKNGKNHGDTVIERGCLELDK